MGRYVGRHLDRWEGRQEGQQVERSVLARDRTVEERAWAT